MNPIQNLEVLIKAVEAHPEDLFHLCRYKSVEQCGTLFCTLGLAASMPEFQEQGIEIKNLFQREDIFDVTINGMRAWHRGVAEPLFGPNAFKRLFEPAGCGLLDDDLGYEDNLVKQNMTDKELALKRLNKQLSLLKEENEN